MKLVQLPNPWTNASFTEHKHLIIGLAFSLGIVVGFALGITLAGFGL